MGSEDDIHVVKSFKASKSQDIFRLCNFLIKNVNKIIIEPIAIVINKLIFSGIFPDLMKVSRVVPVQKKGYTDDTKNYCPISLTLKFSIKHISIKVYSLLFRADVIFKIKFKYI